MENDFVEPWGSMTDSVKCSLEEEVKKELNQNHPLYGYELSAVARRYDKDDVLFQVQGSNKMAVIHLTWSGKTETGDFPLTESFNTIEEFKSLKMKVDAELF